MKKTPLKQYAKHIKKIQVAESDEEKNNMDWLSAILGIVALVGGIVSAVQSNKKAKETDEYNKNLNQTLMDREDSAWQRAVEDRSKSGLSVAGLSQGAGSGGSVSQLQSQQSSAFQNLSNVLQNGAGTMFGLANSAYDRKLQKQIATDELEFKKQQLKHEKLTARLQYMMDLAQLKLAVDKSSDEHKIFLHNMKIAEGKYKDPRYRVYGSEPSEIERLLSALVNNKNEIEDKIYDEFHPEQKAMNDNLESAALSATVKTNNKSAPSTIKNDRNNLPQSFLSSDPDLSHLIPWSYSKNGYDKTITFKNTFTNKTVDVLVTSSQYDYWKNKIENYDYSGWKD